MRIKKDQVRSGITTASRPLLTLGSGGTSIDSTGMNLGGRLRSGRVFGTVLFHKILPAIVIASSNSCSNALESHEKGFFSVLRPALTEMQAHRENVTSSEASMSLLFVESTTPPLSQQDSRGK